MHHEAVNDLLVGFLCLVVAWLLIGFWLLVKNPDMSSVPLKRKRGFWRWVFLCATTVLATNTVILMTHNGYVDRDSTPIRAAIFIYITPIEFLILFILGPLLFRRLGGLAMVGWIIAVVVLLYACQPKF